MPLLSEEGLGRSIQMPTYRDRGIVLRTRPLRDADRHYVIYTEEHGKIVVLAKGSRRGKSKMSSHLASFGIVDVMIAKGRVIDRLAGVSLVRPHQTLLTSLAKTALAQSFLLAVDALVKREFPDERIFLLTQEFLDALETAPIGDGLRSLAFDAAVARLLDFLGFALELRECIRCRASLIPEGNSINMLLGGIECARCRDPFSADVSAEAIKAMRYFRTEPIALSATLRLPPYAEREITFLTDLLITTHLEGRFHALQYLRAVS